MSMNLKEAFRFQNKLDDLQNECEKIVMRDSNVMKVQNTYLRKKVMPEAENETVEEVPTCEYADRINGIMAFMVFLLEQKVLLSKAIREAKDKLTGDMDSEVSLNGSRRHLAMLFARLADLKSSEQVIANGGTGYRFNAEGNQVTYRCDLKKVTTINFDRKKARAYAEKLSTEADRFSAEIDKAMVNAEVQYEAPFPVNGTFAGIFENFAEGMEPHD